MNKTGSRTGSLLIVFLFVLLTSCAINPVTGQRELMLVSEQQELKLGEQSVPSVTWEFGGHYHDSELEAYLGDIVTKLWNTSERSHLPFEFHIQNTTLPNAFALPGYVAITRGLLSDMENEAQFSAVMGHEIGHVMARHSAQRMSRIQLQQIGLAVGSVALEGKKGSDMLLTVGALGSSLLLLKYDRAQEIQSDRLGVKYMSMHGYDPKEAMSAHIVLGQSVDGYLERLGKSREEDTFLSAILSTHPRQEVRLDEIEDMIDQLPPYKIKGDGTFSNRFMEATKDIRAVNTIYFKYDMAEHRYREKKYKEAETLLNEAISLNDSQPPFYNLKGFIFLQQKEYQKAENMFQKALSIESGYQPSIYGMGLASLFEKKYRKAVNDFEKSKALFPNHAPTHFGLGKSYFHLDDFKEAKGYLMNFARAAQKHPEVHGLLGQCFEKTGDLKSAVRAYRNQVAVAPDTKLGRHAKSRLIVLEPLLNLVPK